MIVITGATGKVGRRVVRRLRALGLAHRAVTRRSTPRFDVTDDSTWPEALDGASTVFIVPPDDAPPAEEFARLARLAVEQGAGHGVLLSARTMVDDGPSAIEQAVASAGWGTTFLRPTWFFDNVVEFDLFTEELRHGRLVLPTGDGREALIAADDIAAVAVEAIRRGPLGPLDLSGPAAEVFADAPRVAAAALGHAVEIDLVDSESYRRHLVEVRGIADADADFLVWLMERIAASRDDAVSTVVPDFLGRPARSLIDWAATLRDDAWPARS